MVGPVCRDRARRDSTLPRARGSRARLVALWLLLLPGCGGFSEVRDAGSGDGRPRDGKPGADTFSPGGTGPGPRGALPSGYCCTSASECRYRTCVDLGGGKMCVDPCVDDDACTGPVTGLKCNKTAKRCEPTPLTTACRPSSTFRYGSRTLGKCCLATHNGWAGMECEGYHCISFGETTNPYICTHVCTKTTDCPGPYYCQPVEGHSICWPSATTYTCAQ